MIHDDGGDGMRSTALGNVFGNLRRAAERRRRTRFVVHVVFGNSNSIRGNSLRDWHTPLRSARPVLNDPLDADSGPNLL